MLKQTLFISNRKARRAQQSNRRGIQRKDESLEGGATGGGQNSGGEVNNQPGNTGNPGGSDPSQNNPGQVDDLSTFWDTDPSEGTPNSGSADSPGGSTPVDMKGWLNQQISSLPAMAMTPEMIQGFAEGNPESFNTAMQAHGENVAKHTLGMVVGILKEFKNEVLGEAQGFTTNTLQSKENFADLVKEIPQAAGQGGKLIQDIFSQAMKRNKGNRAIAIQQTKDVMKLNAETFGNALNLQVAPKDSGGGSYNPPAATNWLEELSGR